MTTKLHLNDTNMALLKEDGSLDVERIDKLPLEEWTEEIGGLTRQQYNEYCSNNQLMNRRIFPRCVVAAYPMEHYGVDADEFLAAIRKKYGLSK